MHGIALKDIATTAEVNQALEAAGFQVIEAKDMAVADDADDEQNSLTTPWYRPMETQGGTVGNALRRTPVGRNAIFWISRLAEMLGLFPKGSANVVGLLNRTANAYVAGGKAEVFTPLYCFLARKPL